VDSNGDVAIADSADGLVLFVPATTGTFFGRAMLAGDLYTVAGDPSNPSDLIRAT